MPSFWERQAEERRRQALAADAARYSGQAAQFDAAAAGVSVGGSVLAAQARRREEEERERRERALRALAEARAAEAARVRVERERQEVARRELAEAQARQGRLAADRVAEERLRGFYETDLFPGSGSAGVRVVTPEDVELNRQRVAEVAFGPERGSVIGGDASRLERFIRDWGLSEQEFRQAGEEARGGRVLPALGWGALGLAGAIPGGGQVLKGVARGLGVSADVARVGSAAAGAGRAGRVADISEDIASQFRSGSFNYTADSARLSRVPEYQRDTVEIFSRQGFDEVPSQVSRGRFEELAQSEDFIPVFRGVRDYEGVSARQFVDEFNQGEFFIGGGALGNGAYFTTSPGLAESYRASGNVIEALIPRNARIFDLDGLDAQRLLLEKQQSPFRDLADFLAAKGYDGLRSGDNIVLYNRSVAVVPGS